MDDQDLGSITRLYDDMRKGDDQAAVELWNLFAERLGARAERRLEKRRVKRVVGPDDAVNEAFNSVFSRARSGNFPEIDSRDDLLRILLTITDRKCSNLNRKYLAQKEGGRQIILDDAAIAGGSDSSMVGWNVIRDDILTPEVEVTVMDTLDNLMDALEKHDPKLRLAEMAELRMAGWKNKEIAEHVGVGEKTVERRFQIIRELWKSQQSDAGE